MSTDTQVLTGLWYRDIAATSLFVLSQASLSLSISLYAAVAVDVSADSPLPFIILHPELLLLADLNKIVAKRRLGEWRCMATQTA